MVNWKTITDELFFSVIGSLPCPRRGVYMARTRRTELRVRLVISITSWTCQITGVWHRLCPAPITEACLTTVHTKAIWTRDQSLLVFSGQRWSRHLWHQLLRKFFWKVYFFPPRERRGMFKPALEFRRRPKLNGPHPRSGPLLGFLNGSLSTWVLPSNSRACKPLSSRSWSQVWQLDPKRHIHNFFTLDLRGNWLSHAMHLVISTGFTVSQTSQTSFS